MHGMVQNAREESCKAPYTLNKKPWASFLLKSSNPIDPAWKAARLVHNTEGWRSAASAHGRRSTLQET